MKLFFFKLICRFRKEKNLEKRKRGYIVPYLEEPHGPCETRDMLGHAYNHSHGMDFPLKNKAEKAEFERRRGIPTPQNSPGLFSPWTHTSGFKVREAIAASLKPGVAFTPEPMDPKKKAAREARFMEMILARKKV